ncbi:MAG: Heat shock protein GrpE [uncultured Thiotrichaceae bacterium]|uniref:Protein GrpE n=1 Tax=uncultured Thiotrichaceae bacterium TaxID=298394 RepID=A0A6S6U6Z2_9GAMM|nr:MAG: Heat shock protein GrpE [uncultured Thiotrichaceae bacterium]
MGDNNQQETQKTEEDLVDAATLEQEMKNTQSDTQEAEGIETEEQSEVEIALEKAEAKANENWDKFVRLQAEMDNLRRRNEKQVEDAHKYALKGFIDDLLPVVDSLEMGRQAEGDLDKIREGMDLTLKQFLAVLERQKVIAVSPEGDDFDPDLHQAVAMVPSPDHEDNKVINVMQKGYTINGRLIRPAMVAVCKN